MAPDAQVRNLKQEAEDAAQRDRERRGAEETAMRDRNFEEHEAARIADAARARVHTALSRLDLNHPDAARRRRRSGAL
jgi:hypothetical protein